MFKCQYCNKEFDSKAKLGGHVSTCKFGPNYENNIKHLELARSKRTMIFQQVNCYCQYCNKLTHNKGALKRHEISCIENPNRIVTKSNQDNYNKKYIPKVKKQLSDEHKQKLREKYYEWINEKHDIFLKYSAGQSAPCEHFKKLLKQNNIDFIEEYCPYWKERGYRLDIAFPDEKIGIEINGTQHYNSDGSLNEYTLEKQKFFEERGWKIIQIYYKDVFGNEPKCLDDILKLPIRDKTYIKEEFDYKISKQKEKEIEKEKVLILRKQIHDEEYNKKYMILKNLVDNSGINFSNSGWSGASVKYLKERNELFAKNIFAAFKRYYPDFLKQENVWKRKGSKI